ncbi:MAG: tetratricopeptide repeat protein [Oceanobacter sp.]
MNDRRSLIWSSLTATLLLSSGCATVKTDRSGTIADLDYYELKRSEQPLIVTSEDVVKRFQSYLEVAGHGDMSILAANRVATLRLLEQEAAWSGEGFEDNEFAEVDPVQLEKSIAEYQAVFDENPDYAGNDQILYQLAKAHSINQDSDATVDALALIVEKYPESSYYLDAEFRMGELLYAMSLYPEAEESFKRLVDYGREGNKYYSSAGYMLGWSLFKQNRYDDSLVSFARLLDEDYPDQAAVDAASGAALEIWKDSIYTMAVTFSYRGEWEEIGEFFDGYGKRHYEHMVYDRLADFYYEQKYYQSGASSLTAFVERYPDSEKAPLFAQKIIEKFDLAAYPLLKRKNEADYIGRFGIDSDYWKSHSEAVRDTIRGPLKAYIMDLARFNHGWAQQSKKPEEKAAKFALAGKWYDVYLRSFPDAEDSAEARFLLAEIAYELGDYKKAKDNYEVVAYKFRDHPRAAEAAYATILAFNKYEPVSPEDAAEWRKLSAANSMRFVREFPEHEERGRVLVSTSELFLADKNYDEALSVSRLAWDIKDELSARYRYGAALVRGHASFELGLYEESEKALSEALEYNKIQRGTRKEIRDKIAAAIYKQGEKAKAEGNYEVAVSSWKRLGDVMPGSDNTIIAAYDAAALLLELEKYPEAEEALQDFQNKYPNHKLSKDIPSKLIFTYEKQEKWGKAAGTLWTIWKTTDDKEEKRIACFQAAEYYQKAGNIRSAIAMYKQYAHSYKEPFDPAVEAHAKLDEIYKEKGEADKRRFWLDKVISLHNKNPAKQSERSTYLASKAYFELAEFDRENYESIGLSLPLNKSVPVKNKAMQKAQDGYTQSVELGVLEYTTASTYRIGQLYTQLSQALMNSERPKGLDELELEEYQFLLEDQAYPFEEAAIDIHMKNINRTRDGIYDEWIKRSYGVMADLLPTQYRKDERAPNYVSEIR